MSQSQRLENSGSNPFSQKNSSVLSTSTQRTKIIDGQYVPKLKVNYKYS